VTLETFLIAYGSAVILPLAVVEGPVVSILTGFLCAHGYFVWYWALLLLITGDLIGDALYYWIGRSGRAPLGWLGRHLGAGRVVTEELKNDLRHHATRMLLIGKWTHSLGIVVLVGSGMLRLPLARYLFINFIATLPKSALLFSIGYFAASAYPFFAQHLMLAGVILGAVGATAIGALLLRSRRRRSRR
jgi:membrane protein DedA with SNARE-associated domain